MVLLWHWHLQYAADGFGSAQCHTPPHPAVISCVHTPPIHCQALSVQLYSRQSVCQQLVSELCGLPIVPAAWHLDDSAHVTGMGERYVAQTESKSITTSKPSFQIIGMTVKLFTLLS